MVPDTSQVDERIECRTQPPAPGFNTRILTAADAAAVTALIASREKFIGSSDTAYRSELITRMAETLSEPNDQRLIVGAFEQDRLIATIGMFFWIRAPYWTLNRMVTSPASGSATFNLSKNGLRACMEKCLEIAESRECYRYFAVSALKHHRSSADAWTRHVPRLRNSYEIVIEAVIPANSRPNEEMFWVMMGKKACPVDLIVRSGTLRNAERQSLIKKARGLSREKRIHKNVRTDSPASLT